MDIRILKYFVTVANEGSMTKAADILHVTQPTLSHQLKALEEELGCKLFYRSNYSVKLTDEGILLKNRAEDILNMVQKTETEFKNLYSDMIGTIYIGCSESPYMADFMKILKEFQKQFPKIQFDVTGGTSDSITSALDAGLIDYALVSGGFDHNKYDSIKTPYRNVSGLLMKHNDTFTDNSFIDVNDIGELPLIVCTKNNNMSSEAAAWIKDRKVNVVATYTTFLTAIAMLQADMGYVVCFENMLSGNWSNEFCFKPVSPEFSSNMHIIWKKHHIFTPAAKLLLDKFKDLYY